MKKGKVSGFGFQVSGKQSFFGLPYLLVAALMLTLPGTLVAQASSDSEQAFARIGPLEFRNDVERERYRSLISELRCTVCQNESLAGSDAQLARDLRREIFHMIQDGRSDTEIRNFMVERYGDFVLYRPPLAGHTLLLWLGPLVLLIGSLIGVVFIIRRRKQALR